MSIKTKLERIEKNIKEEKARKGDPTRGDLDLIRIWYGTNEILNNRFSDEFNSVNENNREKLKRIWIKEYEKFNGNYNDFVKYILRGIEEATKKIIEKI